MDKAEIRNIIEAALLAAGEPMDVARLHELFTGGDEPGRDEVREALGDLEQDYAGRGIELKQVASGYRIQVRSEVAARLGRLWEHRPPRYSRALMETLAIIAYRQPVTRGDIEEIRGVAVSTNIMRTLLERGWVRVVGHRDVPGKPAMFGTTREFLDYFNLKKLEELPPLAELTDIDAMHVQLDLPGSDEEESGDDDGDVPPGQHPPLVRAAGEPPEPASVTSLDEARAAGGGAAVSEPADAGPGAAVVPLKTR